MAIPSREKTFALENCRDLLRKLEWEVAGLRATDPNDLDELAFRAFNAAVTAWHMGDWVWADMTEDQRNGLRTDWKHRLSNLGEFRSRAREISRAIGLCREIATASKHVEVTQSPDPTVETTASAAVSDVVVNGDLVVAGDSPVTVTAWALNVRDDDKLRPFLEVLDEALTFWTEFIYPRKIAR